MMVTDNTPTILIQDDEAKEAEFSFFTSDIGLNDVHNKMQKRRRSFFRMSSLEKSLLCIDLKREEEFMRCKPRAIDRIEEPGKKFLCVEYGPEDQPMYWLLDFNETSESLDEWETALRQMMSLEGSFRGRTKSDTSVKRRPSTNKPKRAISAFQQINQPIHESPVENGIQQNLEDEPVVGPVVEPNIEPVIESLIEPVIEPVVESVIEPAVVTTDRQSSLNSDTRDRASSDSDTVSEAFSSIGSLKSEGEDEQWRREFKLKKLQEEHDKEFVEHEVSLEELHKLTFADYEECVYVSEVGADTIETIYIGDKILQVGSKNVNNAHEAINLIRSLKAEGQTQIIVRLERLPKGNLCVIGLEVRSWPQLGIELKGNQIVSTKYEAFRRSCDPAWALFKGERSTRSISAVNDHAVSLHAKTQEVVGLINEALQDEMSIVVFQVHPTEFLKELATSSSTTL